MSSREYAELIQFALDSGRPDLAMVACHALMARLQEESDKREEEMTEERFNSLSYREQLMWMIRCAYGALISLKECGCTDISILINDGLIQMKRLVKQSVISEEDMDRFSVDAAARNRKLEDLILRSGHHHHVKAGRSH